MIPRCMPRCFRPRHSGAVRPPSRPATLVPTPTPGGGSAALQARPPHAPSEPVVHTPASHRPTSLTARRQPAHPTVRCPPPAVAGRPPPRAGGSGWPPRARPWSARASPRSAGRVDAGPGAAAESADSVSRARASTPAPPRWSQRWRAPGGQVGPASELHVERLELFRRLKQQRGAILAVAWRRRPRVRVEARLARAETHRARRFPPWPEAAASTSNVPASKLTSAAASARPAWRTGSGRQSRRSLQECRSRREATATLRSPCGMFQFGRHAPRLARQPRGRGARRGGRRRARDRSPRPVRRARAVARRATPLGTPLSAPAGGGTERGRRSQQPGLRRGSQRARVRSTVGRPPATAARRPPAAPLPPTA